MLLCLVLDKFDNLTDFSYPHTQRKVLAGTVMTTGTDVKDAKVIAFITETKYNNGKFMSDCSLALNVIMQKLYCRNPCLDFIKYTLSFT